MILPIALGAWAGGDRTAFGQTMLAHPLVAATASGFVCGVPREGLWIGVSLALLSAAAIPVGETRVRDWTSAAVVAPALLGPEVEPWRMGAALIFVAFVAIAGGRVIDLVRELALRRAGNLSGDPAPETARLDRLHLGLAGLHFVRGAVVVAAGVWLGGVLLDAVGPRLPEPERVGLTWLGRLAPAAGLPILVRTSWPMAPWPWLLAGCALGGAVFLGWRGIGS